MFCICLLTTDLSSGSGFASSNLILLGFSSSSSESRIIMRLSGGPFYNVSMFVNKNISYLHDVFSLQNYYIIRIITLK